MPIRRAIFVLGIFTIIALYIISSILISNILVSSNNDRMGLYIFGSMLFYPGCLFLGWGIISLLIIQPIVYILKGHQEEHIFWVIFYDIWEYLGERIKNWINTENKIKKIVNKEKEEWEQYLPEVEKIIHPWGDN